jgi:hypothetical protein
VWCCTKLWAALPKVEMQVTQPISSARWRAVQQLQDIRWRRRPNFFEFDIADYAGGLVLSPTRSEDGFLVINALKDARSVLIRRKRRDRARGMIPLLGSNAGDNPLEVAPEVQRDKTYAASQGRGTEHTVGWREIYDQLAKLVAQRNHHAAACLDAWRNGADLNETAARLGISRDYVKKLRGLIRTTAAAEFPEMLARNSRVAAA